MAKSGYFENTFQTGYSLRVEWAIQSQSVADNTSRLAVTAYLVSGGSSYRIESNYSKEMTMTIDGVSYSGTISNASLGGGESRAIMSQTVTIRHNADGSRSVPISFGLRLNATLSGTSFVWVYAPASGTATAKLDSIPRSSNVTLSASTIEMGKALTITIARASSSFTHTLLYGWYGEYLQVFAAKVGTSYTWTVPLSFANNIPDATSGWGTIRVETYNGSTMVGYTDVTFTATVPASVKPTCSIQVLDATDIKDRYGNLVKSLSKLYVKTTATPAYNSPITAYRVTANGTQYTTAEITTEEIKAAGTTTVSASVVDKRGRTSATASASFPVLDYSAPKVTALAVHRCAEDGTEDENGDYIKATFSAEVTPLNNKNTATYTLQYKKSTADSWTTVNLTAFANTYAVTNHGHVFSADSNASYDVIVTAKDNHGSGSRATSASTAFTLMNWNADGTGMGIGKVSEKSNALEIGLRAYDEYGKHLSNGMSLYGGANSPIDPDTSTEHLILTNLNTPTDGLWYVETIFYSTKQPTSDRRQVAMPYRRGGATYSRYYTSGAWSAWESDLLAAWPVGSIYIAYSHTDPSTLFGGTWARITNRFLWATTSGGTIGQMGGESTHTLTVNEMPAHSHGSVYSQHADNVKDMIWYTDSGTSLAYGPVVTGGGQPHNNMPPYIQVSVWRRTA